MLTLQYVPYAQIENLSGSERVDLLLSIISENKIILLEGKLKKSEEAALIRKTMELIGDSDENSFKGIELSTINPESHNSKFFSSLKSSFVNMLLGDRKGMTIVGPASIVKEIKQDPEKIELFINNLSTSVNSLNHENGNGQRKKSNIAKRKK